MAERPPERQDRHVAILMDFENTKDANLQRILSHAAAFGQVIIRRAYADWARHANAQTRLREAGFEAVHQFTTGAGSKNATDINLTVDGMDILWSRPVDVFVLVTADSDFAKLAMRIREGGKTVVGIGAKGRVGRALVQACDHYIYYDDQVQQKRKTRSGEKDGKASERKEKSAAPRESPAKPTATPAPEAPRPKPSARPSTDEITKRHMIVLNSLEAAADDDGWVYGSSLHRSIKRLEPDFDYREFGTSTFRGFIDGLAPVFETETDPARSDFLVWIADPYEQVAWDAVAAKDREVNAEDASLQLVLSPDVQDRIDAAWTKLAGKRGRLTTNKAGGVVATEYGVDKLADTPLGDLDGVLQAAPRLEAKWRRDKNQIVRK